MDLAREKKNIRQEARRRPSVFFLVTLPLKSPSGKGQPSQTHQTANQQKEPQKKKRRNPTKIRRIQKKLSFCPPLTPPKSAQLPGLSPKARASCSNCSASRAPRRCASLPGSQARTGRMGPEIGPEMGPNGTPTEIGAPLVLFLVLLFQTQNKIESGVSQQRNVFLGSHKKVVALKADPSGKTEQIQVFSLVPFWESELLACPGHFIGASPNGFGALELGVSFCFPFGVDQDSLQGGPSFDHGLLFPCV